MSKKFAGGLRGLGFVEMETEEQAQAAIELWDGKDLGGRRVVVNVARPLAPRSNNYSARPSNRKDDDSEFNGY